MKKLLVFASLASVLAVGALFLGGAPGAAPVPSAAQAAAADTVPALASLEQPAFAAADAPASLPVASATAAFPIYATEPEAPLALLVLALCMVAGLTLARGSRGAKLSLTRYLRFAFGVSVNALDRMISAVFPSFHYGRRLAADEWTRIADVWVPEVVAEAMQEPVVQRTAFLDSGVVASNAELNKRADGPGTKVEIPFVIEPNHVDQLQQQGVAPEIRRLTTGEQDAAICNRVSTLGAHALANVVGGVSKDGDLITVLARNIQGLRKRQRNRLVLSQLSGLFDVTAAPDANTGAFKALRYDKFSETGANPDAAKLIDSTKMLYALALLGENKELMTGGAILMHSQIEAALSDQDQIDYVRNSEGDIVMRSWKGMKIFLSDLLVRNGGVSGKVYYTFFCGLSSIAQGDKPQVVTNKAGYVAAVQFDDSDVAKNDVAIYDRTRFILHPQGAKWNPQGGVPAAADAGPSNTEFEDDANWSLGANDVKNTRIVCLRTNG